MRTCTLIVLSLLSTPVALAQPVDFEQALIAADAAPGLRGQASAIKAHQLLARRLSGRDANPQLVIYPGWRFGPDAHFEMQGQLTQSFLLSDFGDARRTALSAEAQVLRATLAHQTMRTRQRIAQAWIRTWAAKARHAVAQDAAEQAQTFLENIERAVKRRVVTIDAAADARAEMAAAQLAVLHAEGLETDAGFALAEAMQTPTGEPISVRGALPRPVLPDAGALDAIVLKAANLPRVRRARLTAMAAHARRLEAEAQSAPRMTAGVMGQIDDGWVAFGVIGITLPVLDAGERDRAGLVAQAHQAQGRATTVERQAVSLLRQTVHEVAHTRDVEAALQSTLIPALQSAVDARARALKAGQTKVFEVLRARRRLVIARRELVDAQAQRALAEVNAWLLLASLDQGER